MALPALGETGHVDCDLRLSMRLRTRDCRVPEESILGRRRRHDFEEEELKRNWGVSMDSAGSESLRYHEKHTIAFDVLKCLQAATIAIGKSEKLHTLRSIVMALFWSCLVLGRVGR